MSQEIKFGTDGWRAVIGDEFTFKNLERVAQAVCDVVRKSSKKRLILVGYDNRFFSLRFAETVGRVAQGNGFKVELSTEPLGSPVLSFAVKERKAAIGFMITASHNPSQFNGFKLKGPEGGSVNSNFTRLVEEKMEAADIKIKMAPLKKYDFSKSYFKFIRQHVKLNLLGGLKSPVIFDPMHGPGGKFLEEFLSHKGKIQIINGDPDPLFGGINPEPIENNLRRLKERVKEKKASAGFALDGDSDRLGVVDENGRFLPPHTVMPLLLLHLLENRKLKGKVIQTVSMGYLPQRIAKNFNAPFEEVPVGFKNIAAKMHVEKVLLGGEESGGYGIGLWFPERDGILCALLLMELMAMKKQPLSLLVDDLHKRFGASHFKRVDFSLPQPVDTNEWVNRIVAHVGPSVGGKPVKTLNTMDGVKIVLEDDSWVLMRPSGTEPLIRTYSESPASQTITDLLIEADKWVHLQPEPPKKTQKGSAKKRKEKLKSARLK